MCEMTCVIKFIYLFSSLKAKTITKEKEELSYIYFLFFIQFVTNLALH